MNQLGTIAVAPSQAAIPKAAPAVWPFLRAPFWVGIVIVAIFFAGFGGWAALAPLSSGAIAAGRVSPESSRKVIQHLEGGIIRVVHVHENQRVNKGDPLITLESTRAEAAFTSGRGQWLRLLVVRARLDAHSAGLDAMVLPSEVSGTNEPEITAFIANQQRLFDTQRRAQTQQTEIFDRQIQQLQSESQSLQAEIGSLQEQRDQIEADLLDAENLLGQQLIARTQVSALRREQARLDGEIASNQASIARAGQSIEEIKLSILHSQQTFNLQIADEATQVNNQIAVLDQDMGSSGDILRRTEIVSPVDGIVLNMRNQTVGGIVLPGEPIMEVVPIDDDLLILARLSPRDIELVTVGMRAHVSLLPFASRNLLPLNGEVVQIAADSTYDDATRQYFYEIRVSIPASELAKHDKMYMSPGMPAEVTIVTGSRTMLQYIAEPLLRAIRNAFIYD